VYNIKNQQYQSHIFVKNSLKTSGITINMYLEQIKASFLQNFVFLIFNLTKFTSVDVVQTEVLAKTS